MLDILRRKARSWVTYLILGGLILVFALFFGFTDMGGQGTPESAATVNDQAIGLGEYDLALENNEAYYRTIFKDGIPDQFRDGIRQSTIQQLINQRLLAGFASQHGLYVSDEELAKTIRGLPYLQNSEGIFDPLVYHDRVIPSFQQQYQIHFESWIRGQLLADRVRQLIRTTVWMSDDALRTAHLRTAAKWTFEYVTIDPAALVEAKKLGDAAQGEATAQTIQAIFDEPKARKKLLETYGLTVATTPELTLAASTRPMGVTDPEAVTALFQLTTEASNCAGPYQVGATWIVCRLLTRTTPEVEDWDKTIAEARTTAVQRAQQESLDRWLKPLTASATITRRPEL
jgi:hypothetical protein